MKRPVYGKPGDLCPICKAGGNIETILDENGHCPKDICFEEHGAEFIDRCSDSPAVMDLFDAFAGIVAEVVAEIDRDEQQCNDVPRKGDLLLFHKSYFISHIIGFITRSRYSHAAIYFGDETFGEFMYCVGYKRSTLESIQGRKVTVFRAKCSPAIRRAAADHMKELMGQPYSWMHVFKAYLYRRIPAFLRPAWMNEELCRGDYHCSQSVSKAYRLAGFDLVLGKPDWATAPGDIAASERVEVVGELKEVSRQE